MKEELALIFLYTYIILLLLQTGTPSAERPATAAAPSSVAKALCQSPEAPATSGTKADENTPPSFGTLPTTSTPAKPFSFAQPAEAPKLSFGGGDAAKPTFGGASSAFSFKPPSQESQPSMASDAQKVKPAASFTFGGSTSTPASTAPAPAKSTGFTFSNLQLGTATSQPTSEF